MRQTQRQASNEVMLTVIYHNTYNEAVVENNLKILPLNATLFRCVEPKY